MVWVTEGWVGLCSFCFAAGSLQARLHVQISLHHSSPTTAPPTLPPPCFLPASSLPAPACSDPPSALACGKWVEVSRDIRRVLEKFRQEVTVGEGAAAQGAGAAAHRQMSGC